MACPMQYRRWIGGVNLSAAVASMAVAILLIATASQPAEGQTFTTLHAFNNVPDGSTPRGQLTMDAAGNLYGTTLYGGGAGYGMVFKLVHTGSNWIEQPLYSFPPEQSGNDGAAPYAGITIGPDGNLYGTTTAGGGSARYGTVFKLSPPASVCRSTLCPWTETILYRFSGGSDGSQPLGPVVFDRAGNLYGTTLYGGSCVSYDYGCGVVFKLTRSGSGWAETVLHTFLDSPDGADPVSGLVFDQAGNLYGTTNRGGTGCADGGCGTVFQLAPSGSGWTETILHSFTFGDDGALPDGGLIFDNSGNLYGTTSRASTSNGTVFELTPSGGQWTYTLISDIPEQLIGNSGPYGPVAMDAAGNLYGMTAGSGIDTCADGCGTVFKLTPSASGWMFSLIHEFTGGTDGATPIDGVIVDRNGNLYGTTSYGGASSCNYGLGCGVVFEITP
jgi:uncharacterized repeat protein (TIGR03803 family)